MSSEHASSQSSQLESFHQYVLLACEFIVKAANNARNAAQVKNYETCDFALAQLIVAATDLRSKINAARERGLVKFSEF